MNKQTNLKEEVNKMQDHLYFPFSSFVPGNTPILKAEIAGSIYFKDGSAILQLLMRTDV